MLQTVRTGLSVVVCLVALGAAAARAAGPDAQSLLLSGDYDGAIKGFAADADAARQAGDTEALIKAEGGLGVAYAAIGQLKPAAQTLGQSSQDARAANRPGLAAISDFNQALIAARIAGVRPLSQAWLDTQAQADSAAEGQVVPLAVTAFGEADQTADTDLDVRARVLAVDYGAMTIKPERAAKLLDYAFNKASARKDDDGLLLVAQAAIGRAAAGGNSHFDDLAYHALVQVRDHNADTSTAARATGLLARLYAVRQRYDDALSLTGEAILLAGKSQDLVTQLEFSAQKAQLLEAAGRHQDALDAFSLATDLVQRARPAVARQVDLERRSYVLNLISSTVNARAQLMLNQGGDDPQVLREVRQVLELGRAVDLEAYYADPCLYAASDTIASLDALDPKTAVIYPVVMADRTDIIVATSTTIGRVSVPVKRDTLRGLTSQLSADLRSPKADYASSAGALYDLLVAPLQDKGLIDTTRTPTLVFAPGRNLRGVPLAALYDRKTGSFVVENYAVATALGLSLVDPRPMKRDAPQSLIVGISKARQGYDPLTNVPAELDSVNAVLHGEKLLDQDYTADRFAGAVDTLHPSIVHIASHGHFSKLEEDDFVLTYDAKLTADDFRSLIRRTPLARPLDLLTLSACETAEGDDDAILGLAGSAYQAGARAVFGSLWQVDDKSTAALVPDFYRAMLTDKKSKAVALQIAQKNRIGDPSTHAPYYWAAFIILGNWM